MDRIVAEVCRLDPPHLGRFGGLRLDPSSRHSGTQADVDGLPHLVDAIAVHVDDHVVGSGEHPYQAREFKPRGLSLPGTPECLANLIRQHWGIESLHWLRDIVYREDNSTARTRSGPRVIAALRNLAIGAIRLTGRRDITESNPFSRPSHGPPLQNPQTNLTILKRP